jgi:hypothetical protein
MRHPFDGIITAAPRCVLTSPNRRSVLRWLAVAPASLVAVLTGGYRAAADPPDAEQPESDAADQAKRERVKQYRSFFVVPREMRHFDAARREELGVAGEYRTGWQSRPDLKRTRGYLTWMTAEQAERIRGNPDILAVHELQPGDTMVKGKPAAGPTELIVSLCPNGLRQKPNGGTYLTSDELVETWSTDFAQFGDVEVFSGMKANKVYVWIKSGEVPEQLLAALKADAQVYHLFFSGRPTTMMFGEEGGGGPRPPRRR